MVLALFTILAALSFSYYYECWFYGPDVVNHMIAQLIRQRLEWLEQKKQGRK